MLKKVRPITPIDTESSWRHCVECGYDFNRSLDCDICAKCDEALYGHLPIKLPTPSYTCRVCGQKGPRPSLCSACSKFQKWQGMTDETIYGDDLDQDSPGEEMGWTEFHRRVRVWKPKKGLAS